MEMLSRGYPPSCVEDQLEDRRGRRRHIRQGMSIELRVKPGKTQDYPLKAKPQGRRTQSPDAGRGTRGCDGAV